MKGRQKEVYTHKIKNKCDKHEYDKQQSKPNQSRIARKQSTGISSSYEIRTRTKVSCYSRYVLCFAETNSVIFQES